MRTPVPSSGTATRTPETSVTPMTRGAFGVPAVRPTAAAGTPTTPAASAGTSATPTCGDGSGPVGKPATPGANPPTGATLPTAATAVTGSPMQAPRPATWHTTCRRGRSPTATLPLPPPAGRAARTARR